MHGKESTKYGSFLPGNPATSCAPVLKMCAPIDSLCRERGPRRRTAHDVVLRLVRFALLAGALGLLAWTTADPDLWGHVRFGLKWSCRGSAPSRRRGALMNVNAGSAVGNAGASGAKVASVCSNGGMVCAAVATMASTACTDGSGSASSLTI